MAGIDPKRFLYLAVSGEAVRGGPGVVVVDEDQGSAKYVLQGEIEPSALREGVTKMIKEDDGENYFFLHTQDRAVHVFRYERKRARDEAHAGLLMSGLEGELREKLAEQ